VKRFLLHCLEYPSRSLDHPLEISDELTVEWVVRRVESTQSRLARCEQDGEHAPSLRFTDHRRLSLAIPAMGETHHLARRSAGERRTAKVARVDERERRMAENETLFREVNERVDETTADFVSTNEYFCECANADCTFRIKLTHAQYASIRADPKQFVVLPLHFTPEVETLVVKNEGHWLVRKTGEAGDYVEKLDPRSR
jgi:hypothetical protein